MISFLLKNIFKFHEQLGAGGGILNRGLIESAVYAPFQGFGGQTVFDKAARLGFGLTKNHGFIDGNKRVALHTTELFLRVHNIALTCSQQARVDVMMKIAKGELDADGLRHWLVANTTPAASIIRRGSITIRT